MIAIRLLPEIPEITKGRDDRAKIRDLYASPLSPTIQFLYYQGSTPPSFTYFSIYGGTLDDISAIETWLESRGKLRRGLGFEYSYDILSFFSKLQDIRAIRKRLGIKPPPHPTSQDLLPYLRRINFRLGGRLVVDDVLSELLGLGFETLPQALEFLRTRYGEWSVSDRPSLSESSSQFFKFYNTKSTIPKKFKYLYTSPFTKNMEEILEVIWETDLWELSYYYEKYDRWSIEEFGYDIGKIRKWEKEPGNQGPPPQTLKEGTLVSRSEVLKLVSYSLDLRKWFSCIYLPDSIYIISRLD